MPVVSFNDRHYDMQLIKHYTAHNCGAQELPWLRRFPIYEMPAPLMPATALPQVIDDREEMGNMLKKGSCYMSASQWVQLCQVSQDLWRACLPGRKIFLSL